MTREPYPGWDVDPLAVPEPEPAPRRTGCSVFALLLALILAASIIPDPRVAAAEPEPSGGVGPITVLVIRSGTWAYANASYGARYLAIPEGPGWHVTVCGPKGCLDRVSTDAGPELWLQRAGRIGDLAAIMFEEVCGPLAAGLCEGSYMITGRADQSGEDPPEHPADASMRLEDRPLPATDAAP